MANIFDYVEWRGDLTFLESPFNDIDNLIFSQLSYALWENVLTPSFDDQLTLKEAIEQFYSKGQDKQQLLDGYFSSKSLLEILPLIKESKRFRDLKICAYQNIISYEREEQFSAITMLLPDETVCVSFRGTDDTLLGWKEDFNMSFMDNVPSQFRSTNYLHDAMAKFSDYKFRIVGHSKGGNLAVFSSAHVPMILQKRIIAIYNNDGPGFMKKELLLEGYLNIINKIKTFVPQSSIFGMMLYHDEVFSIVKSNQKSVLQHDAFSWQVKGTNFLNVDERSVSSHYVDKSLKDWVNKLTFEEKQKFVDACFSIIQESGLKTTIELRSAILKNSYTIYKTYKSADAETKKLISEGFNHVFKIFRDNAIPNSFKK